MPQLGGAARRIDQEAAIVDRHALRRRRGAGRVEQEEAVGRGDARQARIDRASPRARRKRRARRRAAAADRDDVVQVRQLRAARQDHLGRRAVLALRQADRRGGAAVREQRLHLAAAIRHVDGLQRRADIAGRRDSRAGIRGCSAAAPRRCRLARVPSARKPAARPSACAMQIAERDGGRLPITAISRVAPRRAGRRDRAACRSVRHGQARAGTERASPAWRSSMRSRHAASASSGFEQCERRSRCAPTGTG